MKETVQTAVVGVTGYAGAELARLLLHHPRLKGKAPVFAGRVDEKDAARGGIPLAEIHPQLADSKGHGKLAQQPFSWELLEDLGVEVLFMATPHEQSRQWAPEALKRGIKVIDLSGAWRLDEADNRAVYKFEDEGSDVANTTQAEAVYGMPELHRKQIAGAQLIANPGCYATSVILPLKPLAAAGVLDVEHGIVADAKSGVSGAGKAPSAKTHYMYAADNLSAYGVFGHRHMGELLEQIGLANEQIIFTPHLLPIPRGILSTIYVHFKEVQTRASVLKIYRDFFAASPMVRLYENGLPQIQYVARSCYSDIGFQLDATGKRAIIVSCLDNLLKGASSQAVQNLNILMGWNEAEGLE
ncbi:N-acetyl-gamma-glutamyl-phosphate reductase [Telmatobacter bradus]|uniref:N-acetyl-gamma-glutamyl-phosphate reductase n=1 Tax=Telmatobacter bradus TaxID=474953 RepID=UPI003B42A5C3